MGFFDPFGSSGGSGGIAASDAMIFKGTLGTSGTITALPTTYNIGWTYRVITAGTYAGATCEVGDLIIALVDRAGTGNVNADWTVAQTNIDVRLNDFINSGQIHKHINKDILDKTTASYSAEDKSTLDLINSDYIKSTDDLTFNCC